MKNRITQLLKDWNPKLPAPHPDSAPEAQRTGYPLPRGINMLMPVELCINRDLLISLLSSSIQELHHHQHAQRETISDRAMTELQAALQQQLAFRAWAREHPASYICIALYPTTDADIVEDLEDLGDL
ncbi:MAG TPA: hypothetical protein VEI47_03265 [Gemmatimonadales bacterium]|nr:hypothetical protein [Gemmatimonadales bacterium]